MVYITHGGVLAQLMRLHTAFRSLIALVFRFADYVRPQPTNKRKNIQWGS